ncbi:RHS repeat domain-containing protein [Pirellulaceae bacterium SH501]
MRDPLWNEPAVSLALDRRLQAAMPSAFFVRSTGRKTGFIGKTMGARRCKCSCLNPLFRNTSSIDALGAVTSTNFDVFGNVTSVVDPLNNTTSYTYNKLQQLVTENKGTDRSFSYDANGNLATLTDRNTRHSFDSAGRLKSITHSKTELGAGVNWDGSSSLPSTGTFAAYFLSYDADNRISSLASRADGFVTKYTYDAFDQRTAKRVDTDGNGTWDRYEVYTWADGQEVQRWVDTDGAGTGQELRLANRYLWAESVDQLLSDEQYASGTGMEVDATTASGTAGTTLWALTDHLGSVRDLLDNNGVVREHNVFDSFGRLIREVDYNSSGTAISSTDAAAVDSIFGYTGRDWDSDIGMQYNRARWYDPQTGRWLSQDPIGFAAGDANLYRYVGNHPTYANDPSGLQEPVAELPKVDPAPRPKTITGWKNPGYPRGSIHSEGSNWVMFKRSLSVTRYKASGFSAENAQIAFERGCFGLTSFRLGRGGRMITAGDGVGAFQSLDDAWNYLLKLRSQGVDSRILVFSSAYPFTFPSGHNPALPFRNEDGSLYMSEKGTAMAKYDFAVLHFDDKQKEFCYESQWNGWSNPKEGQNWFAAYPLGGLEFDIFLVVEISQKQASEAQGLPKLPPGLPPIKK